MDLRALDGLPAGSARDRDSDGRGLLRDRRADPDVEHPGVVRRLDLLGADALRERELPAERPVPQLADQDALALADRPPLAADDQLAPVDLDRDVALDVDPGSSTRTTTSAPSRTTSTAGTKPAGAAARPWAPQVQGPAPLP